VAPYFWYPDDVTVYLVVNDFGKHGRAFVETERRAFLLPRGRICTRHAETA
jgi:hypothetical protein